MASQELPERISDDSVRAIRGAVEQLQTERSQFESFIAKMLDGLEEMRGELVRHEKEIIATEDQLSEKQKRLEEALQQATEASKINKETEAEVERLTQQLAAGQVKFNKLEADRNDLKARLNEAVDELTAVADALEMVQSTERELAKTREELIAAKDQLREFESRPETADVESLQQSIEKLTAELRDSRKETSRLNEKVADQKTMLDEQREKMSKNLDGLRSSLKDRVKSLRED